MNKLQDETLHLEFDFTKCSAQTICWALSAMSYDEDNICRYIPQLFRGFKSRWWAHKQGSHFFGVVLDQKNGRIFDIERGTDGFNLAGKLFSWYNNLRISKSSGGVHVGFKAYGDYSFNITKDYLKEFPEIYHSGHSKGSAVSTYKACLSFENLWNYDKIRFYGFAGPPAGDPTFALRMNEHIATTKMSGMLFVNPGDPIASKKLRDADSRLLNGVDVGNIAILPDINLHDSGLLALPNHSPAQYNATYGLWLNESPSANVSRKHLYAPPYTVPLEDHKLITLLTKLIVN